MIGWAVLVPSSWPASVVCDQCSLKLTANLVFSIDIIENKLNSAAVGVKGSLEASVGASIDWAGLDFDNSATRDAGVLNFPPILFFIGAFPVSIELAVPMSVGAAVKTSASVHMSAGATYSADLELGFQYAFSDNKLSPLSSFTNQVNAVRGIHELFSWFCKRCVHENLNDACARS